MQIDRNLPVVEFGSQIDWATWLEQNHHTSSGVWLKIAKRGAARATVTYPEALDVALCYGWIDGQKDKFDEQHWLQRFTPRRSKSKWSKVNCAKATTLIESGLMTPAGLREVERARADGRWDAAYAGQSTATVPDDLREALDGNDEAREFFSTLDRGNRYAIIYRIQDAKKPETRAARIEKFVAMLAAHEKIHS